MGAAKRWESVDVLIVSLGSTAGLRAADSELAASLRRAGTSVAFATARRPRALRTLALTDLAWALAARRAALAAIAAHRPRAIIYSTTTAALLWPHPGAIRFDAPAAGNRPGRHGLWQRPLERRRIAAAPLLLPWSEGGLAEALAGCPDARGRAVILPVPIEPEVTAGLGAREARRPDGERGPSEGLGWLKGSGRSRELGPERDIAAIAYAANPLKKGVDRVLSAWSAARREGETLVLAGASESELARAGMALPAPGVTVAGPLAPADYRALLRRAHVFLCAPRREDYGIAQLEALAEGCLLVTTPAPGPYAALPLARMLDSRLVTEDAPTALHASRDPRLLADRLAGALRTALDQPSSGYAARAASALAPYAPAATDRVVATVFLPRLLGAADRLTHPLTEYPDRRVD
jgi:glycosyltransferase involved in cell wall biosynthesis